jgi:hypothetical protein
MTSECDFNCYGAQNDYIPIPKRLVERQIAIATTMPTINKIDLLDNINLTNTLNRPEKYWDGCNGKINSSRAAALMG